MFKLQAGVHVPNEVTGCIKDYSTDEHGKK